MSMRWLLGAGQHRRGGHQEPPRPPSGDEFVLTAPANCDMTVDDLRRFLAETDLAAIRAGVSPGGLRPLVAVRFSGAVKGIWVRIPSRQDDAGGVPGS